ncbi:PREDICTED: DNA-binding protein inhibitor ID-3-A-like [Nanorana parkeri]|uniref:DNA-binding protein inhibitor ID-3-A-like n=1 Tax=Nanorana parkeri TaxID=125878 RepID=UPI000854B19A|nr:PREDICTED: DNA-binding protein inhibitor ID-3-A-like [Nanorana parkeri]
MKAISPVRAMPSCYQAVCCLSEQSLSIARSSSHKGGVEEPMGLLYDMNDCYSKLKELVPGIPQGSKLSQVEILQHVIDYIFDLQIVLGEEQQHGGSILSLQNSNFSEMSRTEDSSVFH